MTIKTLLTACDGLKDQFSKREGNCKAHPMDNPSAVTVLQVCIRGWVIPVKSRSRSFQLNPEAGHSSNFQKQILYAEVLSVAATRMHAASDSRKHKMNALHEF